MKPAIQFNLAKPAVGKTLPTEKETINYKCSEAKIVSKEVM